MGNSESRTKNLEGKPIVVVIGGGFAGIRVAKDLDEHCNVIMIERKDHFFNNIGSLRATVDPSFASKIIIPYNKLLRNGHVIQAEVTKITNTNVSIQGRDEPISFDYLVICTGSNYAFPSKVAFPEAKVATPLFEESAKAVKEAKSILIIGGGPVGVELVGEIGYLYPQKKITMVQSGKDIIPGNYLQKLRDELKKKMKDMLPNFTLILDDKAILDETLKAASTKRFHSGIVTVPTEKGQKIQADLVFFCGGAKVNSASYSKTFEGKVDENGRLKVNQYFQVEGYDNIFAVGDCANVAESKIGFLAGQQAAFLAKNLQNVFGGKAMKEYQVATAAAILIPLGPKSGVSQLPMSGGMIVGARITSMFKSESLFAAQAWTNLNQKSNMNRFVSEKPQEKEIARMSSIMKISEEDSKKLLNGIVPAVGDGVEHT